MSPEDVSRSRTRVGPCGSLITAKSSITPRCDPRWSKPVIVTATRSDTETIVHAYEEFGPASLSHFRGMFAFAMWDAEKKTLFCARDRLGIKPLYYYWDGALFAFASEIKALLEHPAISTDFDESVLGEYLAFGYISDERTFFRGIRKLMPSASPSDPGSAACAQPQIQIARYWEIPTADDESPVRSNAVLEQDWVRENDAAAWKKPCACG